MDQLKAAYWNASTQAKFEERFPRMAGLDSDAAWNALVGVCSDAVDEYTTLEDAVEGFLNN